MWRILINQLVFDLLLDGATSLIYDVNVIMFETSIWKSYRATNEHLFILEHFF